MAVKAEMLRKPGKVLLAFECSKPEEQEIIDAIRTAIFGDFDKRGGYVDSNRLVVEIASGEELPEEEDPLHQPPTEPARERPAVPVTKS